MGFWGKLFGRDGQDEDGSDAPVTLDMEARRPQLRRLEVALDALAEQMRVTQSISNPGWRGRVSEYGRLAGAAMTLRQGSPNREQILDLVFEIRPVFTGPVPPGLESLVPLQDEVVAAAEELRELLPQERG